MSSSSSPRPPCITAGRVTPARACSPAICLLLLPFHTWAVAVLASVSALAVMPPGRPEDATTATAVPV